MNGRGLARSVIRAYQLTFSSIFGRTCRHLPTCSEYTSEAIERHGVWAGSWMGAARICRCHPLGTHGLDFTPETLPRGARWWTPWRYGSWRRCNPQRVVLGESGGRVNADSAPAQ